MATEAKKNVWRSLPEIEERYLESSPVEIHGPQYSDAMRDNIVEHGDPGIPIEPTDVHVLMNSGPGVKDRMISQLLDVNIKRYERFDTEFMQADDASRKANLVEAMRGINYRDDKLAYLSRMELLMQPGAMNNVDAKIAEKAEFVKGLYDENKVPESIQTKLNELEDLQVIKPEPTKEAAPGVKLSELNLPDSVKNSKQADLDGPSL